MKSMFTCLLWLATTCTLQAMPIHQLVLSHLSSTSNRSSSRSLLSENTAHHHDTVSQKDAKPFAIQLDRFSQLVSTHWQFDHLDAIISNSYKEIAAQMRHHVQIIVSSNPPEQPQTEQQLFLADPMMDAMDLGLLKAQLFGAIQAHTEGSLPMAWDKLADKLSRPALETYLIHLVQSHCPSTGKDPTEGIISLQCLASHALQITSQFDHYVATHVAHVFDNLSQTVLPELFQQTAENLKQVLDYFNQSFLNRDDLMLSLEVIPWQDRQEQIREQLLKVASQNTNNDDHPDDFVSRFAALAQI